MGKIGNHRVEVQESAAYKWGWDWAEAGMSIHYWMLERLPQCEIHPMTKEPPMTTDLIERLLEQVPQGTPIEVCHKLDAAAIALAEANAKLAAQAIEVEVLNDMRQIATETLGYEGLLEALEDLDRVKAKLVKAREALVASTDRLEAILSAMDKYNAETGSSLGGAPFFRAGRQVAVNHATLAELGDGR